MHGCIIEPIEGSSRKRRSIMSIKNGGIGFQGRLNKQELTNREIDGRQGPDKEV